MAFHDVRLRDDIAYGYQAGAGFRNTTQSTASGHEYRIAQASQGRHRYECDLSQLDDTEAGEVKQFIMARRADLHSFRWKDWTDYNTTDSGQRFETVTAADQFLGTCDGTSQQFQLVKSYSDGVGSPYIRPLTLPVAGTLLVAVDGAPTGAYTLSPSGGIITLTGTVGQVVTAGCEFDVPVRFGDEVGRWASAGYQDFKLLNYRLSLIEVLNEVETSERRDPGGSYAETITADVTVTPGSPFVLSYTANAAGLSMFLPAPDRMVGGEIFVVRVTSASTGNLTIRDDSGAAVSPSMSFGSTRRVALVRGPTTASWVTYA